VGKFLSFCASKGVYSIQICLINFVKTIKYSYVILVLECVYVRVFCVESLCNSKCWLLVEELPTIFV